MLHLAQSKFPCLRILQLPVAHTQQINVTVICTESRKVTNCCSYYHLPTDSTQKQRAGGWEQKRLNTFPHRCLVGLEAIACLFVCSAHNTKRYLFWYCRYDSCVDTSFVRTYKTHIPTLGCAPLREYVALYLAFELCQLIIFASLARRGGGSMKPRG